jgi:predicted transcriptional regulator
MKNHVNDQPQDGAQNSYQKLYYREHAAELIERSKKHHAANQPHVSNKELEHLRISENRLESLRYGSEEEIVCLNCGRKGRNLSHHLHGCPTKPESALLYKERWGFDKSNPLASPKQREAYSRSQRQSPSFPQRREKARSQLSAARATRHASMRAPMSLESKLKRRGRRTGARPHRQKIPDAKVLEIFALNLPIAEAAKRAGLSQTALYRRAQRLGWNAESVKAIRRKIMERVFELRMWIFAQPQVPTPDEIVERYMNDLRTGAIESSHELILFVRHLGAELQEHPDVIRRLAAEKKKPARVAFTLASRIFKRSRAGFERGQRDSRTNVAVGGREDGLGKKASERTIEKGKFCDQIIGEMRKIKRLRVDGGRSLVEIQVAHPDLTAWKLRDTLGEEDRDAFNHPRQWGPVVGYAKMVLAKHFDRHPETIRDWVKAYRAHTRKISP